MKGKLKSPCAYQGAKQRVAGELIDYIYNDIEGIVDNLEEITFYDLCCGSGAVTLELLNRGIRAEKVVMCDISTWGAFWKAIGEGTYDLERFYKYSRAVPREKGMVQTYIKELAGESADIDEEYKYILIQAAAFGGKPIWKRDGVWKNTSFRDYWQPTATSSRRSPVNPMQPEIEEIEERVQNLVKYARGLRCYHADISVMLDVIKADRGSKVIYIDSPYTNTAGYGCAFDVLEIIQELIREGIAPIYVSEKERLEGAATAYRLNFSGNKGGVLGNTKKRGEEWLNIFRG